MSIVQAFWDKMESKDQYETRKKEVADALKKPLRDEKKRTTLDAVYKKAEEQAGKGKYKDAMSTLGKLQVAMNAEVVVATDTKQILTLRKDLAATWKPAEDGLPVVAPALEAQRVRVNDAIERDDYVTAQNELATLKQEVKNALSEKATFELRYGAVLKTHAGVEAKVASKAYGDTPPDKLGAAVGKFATARADAEAEGKKGEYAKANTALNDMATAAQEIAKEAPTYASEKERFEARKATLSGTRNDIDGKITTKAYGDTPHDSIAKALDVYTKARDKVDSEEEEAKKSGDYAAANAALDATELAVLDLQATAGRVADQSLHPYDPVYAAAKKRYDALEPAKKLYARKFEKNRYGDPPPKEVKTAYDEADKADGAYLTAISERRSDDALKALDDLKEQLDVFVKFENERADGLITAALGKDGKKPKASRAAIVELLDTDPDILKAVAARDGGTEFLDGLVDDLDGTAKTKADKTFVKQAMIARFGLTKLTGGQDEQGKDTDKGLTTKALPRIYKMLSLVPETHTKDNPLLKNLDRERTGQVERIVSPKPSAYQDLGEGRGSITLKLGRTGGVLALGEDLVTSGFEEFSLKGITRKTITTGKGPIVVNHFNQTTLHEIGHAADDNVSFMKKNGGNASFGGWQKSSPEEFLAVAANDLGFYADFKEYPRAFLDSYLNAVKEKQKPADMLGPLWKEMRVNAEGAAKVSRDGLLKDPAIVEADQILQAGKPADSEVPAKTMELFTKVALSDKAAKDVAVDLISAILRGKPKEAAVDEFLAANKTEGDVPKEPDWKALGKHRAIEWWGEVMLKGDNGLWDKGHAGANKCAVGGRVYQQAYGHEWWSYSLGARGAAVSQYQFRSPAEWFAEAYSFFYIGKLPEGHALYDWLEKQQPPKK
jgi:hypothetical protein